MWRCGLAWLSRALVAMLAMTATPALAGPPFLSDDPAPTEFRHFEIYAFTSSAMSRRDPDALAGIDFNYGATPDLQLTVTVPVGFRRDGSSIHGGGLGGIELAAKLRLLHQASAGWDVAVFPRVVLPSGAGERHAALLLPVWVGRSNGAWSTFGGGGCALNSGRGSRNYCLAGWAVTRRIGRRLQVGGEAFHQTADAVGATGSTTLGLGATWDVDEHLHLLGYAGAALNRPAQSGPGSLYAAALFTF